VGRSIERIEAAKKAMIAFEEVMQIEKPTSIERDAAILRFEFTFEAVWKAAKEVLYEREGIDIGSPKSVIRSCRVVSILTEEQTVTALEMVDDRNLTIHTYNEKLAIQIYSRLRKYQAIFTFWLARLDVE
jgi:nucleotidyltransferase substrate binding protein (TIGR01987 family)